MRDAGGSPAERLESHSALVTGAGGCIGQCPVKRLIAEGCQVHALDVSPAGLAQLAKSVPNGSVHFFRGT